MCPLWPMCFSSLVLSSESPELFFLILFHFCAWSRGACYPLDIFSAWLMLARLWSRSSCNLGPPQQVSCPASVLSPCVWRGQPAAVPWRQLQPARSLCDTDSQEGEGLDSLSHGKCSGSRFPLAFPRLDPSSTKPLNGVCWAAVCSSLPRCQCDRKCPCGPDGCFLKRCQQYQADLVALIFSIHGEF